MDFRSHVGVLFLIFPAMNMLESLVPEVNTLHQSVGSLFGTKDTLTAAAPALNHSREQTTYLSNQSWQGRLSWSSFILPAAIHSA